MNTYKYRIKNLDCANCANELESALNKIDIIENVNISFMTEKLTFMCPEGKKEEALQSIKKVIKKHEPDVSIEEI